MTHTLINQDDPGMAVLKTESFKTIPLFTGDTPVNTTPEVVADAVVTGQDLPAYSVVGRDAQNKLVMADISDVDPANHILPIGITTATVKDGATAKNVSVFRSGMFNPDALNWDASYDDDTKKRLAFEASQPSIFIRKPGYPID